MRYTYTTKGTCSRQISFDLEGNVIKNVEFIGGCNGNLKAISSLVEGLTVEEIEEKVRGIKCGYKDTSCSDQLAIAVRKAYEKENA
ncbi:MAG: TIGR03905 family TSCPD domain-containing protein [Clostridia bacterium]|nr:TIGR03905 family TSCPD domain-containing protein [Clostridia bacterium]